MKQIEPFVVRERIAPKPKAWERGYENVNRSTEWQVVKGRKIVFRANTFKQAEKWAKENEL